MLGVGFHVAADDEGFGAEAAGQPHGHGAVNTVFPRLIAAGRHHAPVEKAVSTTVERVANVKLCPSTW